MADVDPLLIIAVLCRDVENRDRNVTKNRKSNETRLRVRSSETTRHTDVQHSGGGSLTKLIQLSTIDKPADLGILDAPLTRLTPQTPSLGERIHFSQSELYLLQSLRCREETGSLGCEGVYYLHMQF